MEQKQKQEQKQEPKIRIDFTISELNYIIESLSKEPFAKVYKLIEKLHVESKKQLESNY